MVYRKDIDEMRARCLTMGMDFEIEDYKITFNGDNYILEKYLGDELEVYLNDIFDEVSPNAFIGRDIKFIDFGTVKVIPSFCFNNCYTLEKVIAHNVKTVKSEAFKNCFSLKTVEFGKVTEFENRVFSDCINLVELVGLDKLKAIGSSCFTNCYGLEKFNLYNVEHVGDKAFMNCINLKEVYFGKLIVLSKRVFSNCYNLETIFTPNVIEVRPCALSACMKLREISIFDCEDMNVWGTNDALLSLKKIHFLYPHINIDEETLKLRLSQVKAKEVEIVYDKE